MSKAVCRLLGQAVVRHIAGDTKKAAELTSAAQALYDKEDHLFVSVWEILTYKGYSV